MESSTEQVAAKYIQKLNVLRQEQRFIVERMNLAEIDLTETKLVVEALQKVDPERRCFKSEGGVLIEHKVKDVLPMLEESRETLEKITAKSKEDIAKKGKAIQSFMTENNISFKKQ